MGQCGPHKQSSIACLGIPIPWGITATWGGASVLIVCANVGAGVGEIGQSFLALNRF